MKAWFASLFGSPTPVIGAVSRRDVHRLAQLHAASFHRGWSDTEFEQLLGDRNTLTQGLRLKGALVGFIISRLAADEAEILSVAVDAAWRGRGLSSRLLTIHLGHLAGRGIRTVFLEVEEGNTPAIRLYARAGFQAVGRREQYYRGAGGQLLNALIMQRGLS